MQNVLVTGGAGYVGSHVCKQLAKSGFRPVALDNLSRGNSWAIKWGPFEHADILDRNHLFSIVAFYQPVAILHLAALAYVGESAENPDRYYRNNVVGGINVLDAAVQSGVQNFVFSSTCAVYGHPVWLPITEDHPAKPVNPYGETKLALERALNWYQEALGLRSIALRYFNAAGADPELEIGEHHEPETHVIPLITRPRMVRACETSFTSPTWLRHIFSRCAIFCTADDPKFST